MRGEKRKATQAVGLKQQQQQQPAENHDMC